MSWLLFVFALELGVLPNTSMVMYQPMLEYVVEQVGFYTQLEAELEAFGFYAGGGMRAQMWLDEGALNFWPNQMNFAFTAGWRNDWLQIGFKHYCMHPVVPYLGLVAPTQNWEGSYEELFVRVNGGMRCGR